MNCVPAFESDGILVPAARPERVVGRRVQPTAVASASGLQVFVLVMWMGCLSVGGIGLALPYIRPVASVPEPQSVKAEFLNADLTQDAPEPDASTAASETESVILSMPMPAMASVPVAEPSPAIAFAVPVQGPSRIVSRADAVHAGFGSEASANARPAVQSLTFGQGEGKQPAPDYPMVARRAGQEGAVRVRFTVDVTGRVLAAEAIERCPWPMLVESAVRTVSKRWRFATGPVRLYEVSILFQLSR